MAQPIKDWDKGYGGAGWEDCNAVIQTTDLGYFLGGYSTSNMSGDVSQATRDDLNIPWWYLNVRGDYWVLRTDEDGNKLWEARFGGNKEDRLWGVEQTDDGGFILGGGSYSDISGEKSDSSRGSSDYWIVKIDDLGNKEWDKTYGGDSTDILNVLIQTQDGGYMLGGWSRSSGWTPTDSIGEKSDTLRGDYDWWIVKIDELGAVQWEKSYGGNDTEQLADIVQKEDGSYLLAGGTDSDISGEVDSMSRGLRDYWLLHIDSVGNKLKEYRYGGDGFDDLNKVIISSDSTYILAGSSYTLNPSGDKTDPGFGNLDWWVMKIDTTGTILWQHTFGGADMENVYSLSQNTVDHYLLGGFSNSVDGTLSDNPTKGSNDYWIMYLDTEGNKLWDERYGGDQSESLEQLFQTADGGYLLAGHSQTDVNQDKTDPTNGGNDFWIVKTLCNISIELNDTIVCPGDSVLINAYNPDCIDCTYSWSDDISIHDSIRIISTQDDITYTVTLTDGVGCQRSDDINIAVYTQVLEGTNLTETCDLLNSSYVVTFEITGSTNTFWVTGDEGALLGNEFTSVAIPKDSSYAFYIHDGNGCEPLEISGAFDCLCVTDPGEILETGLNVCGSDTLTATHGGSNLDGNDLLEFIVHDGDASNIGNTIFYTSNIPEFSFQPGMQYGVTYFVTVIASTDDGNGNVTTVDDCYAQSAGVPIVFYESPLAIITAVTDTEIDCIETSLHLIGNDSQTQGGISFEWSVDGIGNIISGTTNDLAQVDEEGTYVLTITDLATGCTASTSIDITIDQDPPVAMIAEPQSLTCNELTVELNANGSSDGPNFNYQWSGGVIDTGEQSLNPIVSASAFYTLLVTDINNGCTVEENIFVNSDTNPPIVNAGQSQQLDCILTESTLDGSYDAPTINVAIQWITNSGNIISGANTLFPVVDEEGTYTLIITNLDNGCTGEANTFVTLNFDMPQSAETETIDPECFGDETGSITIIAVEGGTSPYTYSIDGENFYVTDQFDNLSSGTYNLIVQDANGCEWDTLIDLQSPPILLVELGDNIIIDLGESVRLDAIVNQSVDTFIWNFPDITTLSPLVQPTEQTSYQIQVVDTLGCEAEDDITIFVRKNRKVFIPTAFSPNDDGYNDYFRIFSDQSVININQFRIFDRWGETLYSIENIQPNAESTGWDGVFKGYKMPAGVYIYFAEIQFLDGRVEIFKGDVTLLR